MLNGRNRLLVLFIGAALFLAVLPAHASSVTYTDPTAWGNATNGDQEITFTGIAPSGSFTNEGTATGLTIDGVQFIGELSSSQYQLQVEDQLYGSPYYNWGAPATLQGPNYYYTSSTPAYTPSIQVNLPSNTTAFAVDLATLNTNGLTYQVTLSDGEVFDVATGTRPNLTFFGITAASPITWANFVVLNPGLESGSYGLMANFQFGTADTGGQPQDDPPQVPEACTLILIGSGLVAMRVFRKHLTALV